MPDITQLSVPQVLAIRQRLVDDLAANWPQLDTRPNSVAGDLGVTPVATLIAKAEAAAAMLQSDLNLGNVAKGVIYNPAFVTAFLSNFGITQASGLLATGVMAMTFSINKNYIIPANTVFTFPDGSQFQFNPGSGNPVVIYAYDPSNPSSSSNQWVLHQTDVNAFTVYLPVTGTAGSTVINGDSATYSLTTPELVSATAVGDFNSGSQAENLPQMAARAQQTFAAPNLMTRSGAISFLLQRWPQLISKYVSITGDAEMLRAGRNPLGIVDGAMDVFVKSQLTYPTGMINIPLVYDSTQGAWVGAVSFPTIPAFYSMTPGIFQTANFQNMQSVTKLYSKSTHPTTDSLAVAFSKWEALGIRITDQVVTNFQPANNSAVTAKGNGTSSMSVSGEYCSGIFNATVGRSVQIRIGGVVTHNGNDALQANIVDISTGDTGSIFFMPNANTSPTGCVVDTTSADYLRLLNGLTLSMSSTESFALSNFTGGMYSFSFTGRTAYFTLNYIYDPVTTQVDSVLQNVDNKPIGVDVVTRCFMPCYISKFNVNYRIGFGSTFNEATARQNIYNYLSTLTGPNVYEESRIGQIVLAAGASGLIGVEKNGTFFPSLASVYVDANGTETAVPRYPSNSLQIPTNNNGISANTVTYVTSPGTIQFNATVQ